MGRSCAPATTWTPMPSASDIAAASAPMSMARAVSLRAAERGDCAAHAGGPRVRWCGLLQPQDPGVKVHGPSAHWLVLGRQSGYPGAGDRRQRGRLRRWPVTGGTGSGWRRRHQSPRALVVDAARRKIAEISLSGGFGHRAACRSLPGAACSSVEYPYASVRRGRRRSGERATPPAGRPAQGAERRRTAACATGPAAGRSAARARGLPRRTAPGAVSKAETTAVRWGG